MTNNITADTILSKIDDAASIYKSGNQAKYQAIAEFYRVYLAAKNEPALASAIRTQYAKMGFSKTRALTNMVLKLAFQADVARQRISDMHKLLLECEQQDKKPDELPEWFTAEGGWRSVLRLAAQNGTKKRGFVKSAGSQDQKHDEQERLGQRKLFDALFALGGRSKIPNELC